MLLTFFLYLYTIVSVIIYIMTIISKSQLQKKISVIGSGKVYTVVNHGHPEAYILPYFEGADDFISDFIEDCEMIMNRERLKVKYQESLESGVSDLTL